MGEIINIKHLNIHVQVPNFFNKLEDGKVIWLRQLHENIFEASIFIEKDDGYVNYTVIIGPEMDIKPITNANTFNAIEYAKLKLGEKLGINLRQQVLIDRVKHDNLHIHS